jgi:hypothetical protein
MASPGFTIAAITGAVSGGFVAGSLHAIAGKLMGHVVGKNAFVTLLHMNKYFYLIPLVTFVVGNN